MTDLDYGRFEALTFDCYGTLIDWEAGILAALRRVLGAHGVDRPDDELLEAFAAIEAPAEAGPYRTYREILAACVEGVAAGLGVEPDPAEVAAFAEFGRRLAGLPRLVGGPRSGSTSASASASSPTATTTCSPARPHASASTSTGS